MPKGQYKYMKVIRPKNIGRFIRENRKTGIYMSFAVRSKGEKKWIRTGSKV